MTPDLRLFADEAARRQLAFLLVGGYAVNAHGYSRKTFDIDFLIRQRDSNSWREVLSRMGYACVHEQITFSQYAAPDLPDIDLMRVNDETFDRLFSGSEARQVLGLEVHVPALEDLIAMKLHAAKHAAPHRRYKDLIDIFYLVDANKVDVSSDRFREMCEKYGTPEIYADILKAARK